MLNSKDFINIINQEITWCENNRDKSGMSEKEQDAFILGLKQSIILIENSEKVVREGS